MGPKGQLAARRKALGFSQESLARTLDISTQTVSRWELGLSSPRARYRAGLAEALNLTTAELEHLLTGNGSLIANGHAVPAWLSHYASLEQGASKLHGYEPVTVPGLLQTRAYTVMRAQLDHLCTMAAQPSISLRVLPLSCAAGHSAAFGSFDLFTSAGSPAPFMACAETLTGFSYSDSPTAIENYRLLFNHLYEKALPPSESANLIRTTSMEHYE